jgi:signal transduction histidine kinase
VRFDDSLETVLAADMSSPFGAQSAWRQLVDLVGRGRVLATVSTIARLRAIRPMVAAPVRAASARAIAGASPPVALIRLFVEDEIAIAAPLLRVASLPTHEWIAMLPAMSPATRSILRHRRDLAPDVRRALESFGRVDFVLSSPIVASAPTAAPDIAPDPVTEALAPEPEQPTAVVDACLAEPTERAPVASFAEQPLSIDWTEIIGPLATEPEMPVIAEQPAPAAVAAAPLDIAGQEVSANEDRGELATHDVSVLMPPTTSFVSIASVARGLPVVAEALRQTSQAAADTATVDEVVTPPAPARVESAPPSPLLEIATPPLPPPEATAGTFQIAELVARIDAYQRQREDRPAIPLPATGPEVRPELFALDHAPAESFRFETDAAGVVRWIEGAARAPLIGLSLDLAALPAGSQVDGVAAGAFRRRASFANARLVVEGHSDAAGQWRISGIPVFDRASGRFTGYRGTARRPRADEMAESAREGRNPASDALRQLVHELRTPANAIAGFAEMIESQLLGPVPQPYRVHAAAIRNQTHDLLGAIDDIDMAARIESDALDLRPGDVPVAPLLARVGEDLAPLARLRGATLAIDPGADGIAIAGDDRAVERLIARLMATLVSSGSPDERIAVAARGEGDRTVLLSFDRPRALGAYAEEKLLTIDAEVESEREGAPLLGTGFALRLARNLAMELGGTLTIGEDRLTLRLPAAFLPHVEQVSSN